MSTIADHLVAEARRRGVPLRVDGGELVVGTTGAGLDPRISRLFEQHAAAVVARLADREEAAGSWLRPLTPGGRDAVVHLFPAAGTGPGTYRAWAGAAPAGVDVVAVQYPGREARIDEPPMTDVTAVAGAVAERISRDDRPTVLVGHSTGGLVAREVAVRLRVPPRALVVAATESPDLAVDLTAADDEELRRAVGTWTGDTAPPDPEVLRCLRADLRVHRSCRREQPVASPVAVTAVAGRSDASLPVGMCAGWVRWTSGRFSLHEVDGGHFFPVHAPATVLDLACAGLSG